jgi:hypothetical protein
MPVTTVSALGLVVGIIALILGIIVIIFPKILNYLVSIYLIIIGLIAIMGILKGDGPGGTRVGTDN